MSTYETAPATKLVATHCACCGKALIDAPSLETGMGPVCRKRHGFSTKCDATTRARVNALIYVIAAHQTGEEAVTALAELRTIFGFEKLAARIADRLGQDELIEITQEGDTLVVKSPYSADAVALLRTVPGRQWDGARKVNNFPTASREPLFWALRQAYPGHQASGPKGLFTLLPIQPGEQAPVAPVTAKPAPAVLVERSGEYVTVKAPYNAGAIADMRFIRGRRWDPTSKTNSFPFSCLRGVLDLLSRYYGAENVICHA